MNLTLFPPRFSPFNSATSKNRLNMKKWLKDDSDRLKIDITITN